VQRLSSDTCRLLLRCCLWGLLLQLWLLLRLAWHKQRVLWWLLLDLQWRCLLR